MRALRIILLASAIAAIVPAAALAACPQTSVADLEDEVMCPVCGTALGLAIEAPQAQRQRAFILELVEQCRSKDQIKQALTREFGPAVLALPPASGFDLAAYLVPLIGALIAVIALAVLALRWRRRRPTDGLDDPPPTAGADDAARLTAEEEANTEDAARLDADLRRYDL